MSDVLLLCASSFEQGSPNLLLAYAPFKIGDLSGEREDLVVRELSEWVPSMSPLPRRNPQNRPLTEPE